MQCHAGIKPAWSLSHQCDVAEATLMKFMAIASKLQACQEILYYILIA